MFLGFNLSLFAMGGGGGPHSFIILEHGGYMNNKTAIVAVVVVLVIIVAAAAVVLSSGNDESQKEDTTPSVNDPVVGYYSYTCTFVEYYQTNPLLMPTLPSQGNTFAKVDIKIKNIDSDTLTTSKTNFKFTADGVTYSVDKVDGNSGFFADEIDIGDTVRVTFYYEVPLNTTQTELTWVGDENVQLNYAI